MGLAKVQPVECRDRTPTIRRIARQSYILQRSPEKWIFRETCSLIGRADRPTPLGPDAPSVLLLRTARRVDETFPCGGHLANIVVGIIVPWVFAEGSWSLVTDRLRPLPGRFTGNVDCLNLFVVVHNRPVQVNRSARTLPFTVRVFPNSVISFLIASFAVFLLVRYITLLHEPSSTPEPGASILKPCPVCVLDGATAASRYPSGTAKRDEQELRAPPTL